MVNWLLSTLGKWKACWSQRARQFLYVVALAKWLKKVCFFLVCGEGFLPKLRKSSQEQYLFQRGPNWTLIESGLMVLHAHRYSLFLMRWHAFGNFKVLMRQVQDHLWILIGFMSCVYFFSHIEGKQPESFSDNCRDSFKM